MRRSKIVVSFPLALMIIGAIFIAPPSQAQPTEEDYHLAAIDYAANEQAGAAASQRYSVAQLKKDAETVGRCENHLQARSRSMYVTSWQHHPSYWNTRLADYENWLRTHNQRNPNHQLAMPQRNSRTDLDPLTGARVSIWWMLHRRGGTWRGSSGWPSCGSRASR
jgi:hypothetical protein